MNFMEEAGSQHKYLRLHDTGHKDTELTFSSKGGTKFPRPPLPSRRAEEIERSRTPLGRREWATQQGVGIYWWF
jgi:hypothetical protein